MALQHMCEFTCCEGLSRRLATSCAKKAAVICSVLSETTLRTLNQPAVFSKQIDRTGKNYFIINLACCTLEEENMTFKIKNGKHVIVLYDMLGESYVEQWTAIGRLIPLIDTRINAPICYIIY